MPLPLAGPRPEPDRSISVNLRSGWALSGYERGKRRSRWPAAQWIGRRTAPRQPGSGPDSGTRDKSTRMSAHISRNVKKDQETIENRSKTVKNGSKPVQKRSKMNQNRPKIRAAHSPANPTGHALYPCFPGQCQVLALVPPYGTQQKRAFFKANPCATASQRAWPLQEAARDFRPSPALRALWTRPSPGHFGFNPFGRDQSPLTLAGGQADVHDLEMNPLIILVKQHRSAQPEVQ